MNRIQKLLPQVIELVCSNADRLITPSSGQVTAKTKSDGSLVTEIDTQMQSVLSSSLNRLMPEVNMLGEEMTPTQQQHIISSGESFWCLDPIDGTNNFYHGVPLYAVSLALVVEGEIRLGIIYDPIRKECFSSTKGGPMCVNGSPVVKPIAPETLQECLASIDFKRLKPDAGQKIIATMPFKSQRNIGTCALEWAWLAAGRIQLLLHGGEKVWDYAAGSLILESAGGVSCTKPGEAVFNGSLQPRAVIAASDENLHQQWIDYLIDYIKA